ncbi:DNA repair protein RecO [Candidatus Wolfebacteria bacterium]|nr:MAG: DNA repair protein RecO [Candidatus Wolfebacteria bacterium]
MYDVHTTEGIVLASTGIGEANKLVTLFTSDFGLVYATAQGVRLQKSKLRFRLVDYSVISLSLVRGRGRWRLTNVLEDDSSIKKNQDILLFRARIGSLLKRLIHGEESDPTLFSILNESFKSASSANADDIEYIETLTVLRMLNRLGYIGDKKLVASYCESEDITNDMVQDIKSGKKDIVRIINMALRESQL